MRAISLLTLAACGGAIGSAAQLPPPGLLGLDVGPVVIDAAMTLTATGAQAGDTVYFGLGQSVGNGPCPPALGGDCLGITGHVQLLGTAVADAAGVASVTLTVPSSVPEGYGVVFQAAVLAGSSSLLSEPMATHATHFWTSVGAGDVLLSGLDYDLAWQGSPGLAGDVNLVLATTDVPLSTLASGGANLQVPSAMPMSRNYRLRLDAGPYVSPSFAIGALVGFSWDGSQELMQRVDPITGLRDTLGVVDDLATWSGATLWDRNAGVVYVAGTNTMGEDWLYRLADDGTFLGKTQLPVDSLIGEQMLEDGTILTFSWNGTEELMHILEPNTGLLITRGTVPDLMWWSGETFVDEELGLVWVLGTDSANASHIWTLDLASGDLVSDLPVSLLADFGSGLKLRNDGMVVGARWNGVSEELVETDLTTGVVNVIGGVGDLAVWSGSTVLTPSNDRFFVWGNNGTEDKLWVLDPYDGTMLREHVLASDTSMTGQLLIY